MSTGDLKRLRKATDAVLARLLPKVTAAGFKYVNLHALHEGFVLCWGYPGIGFGELTFWLADDGWHADTECMGPDFCAAAMEAWVRSVVKDERRGRLNDWRAKSSR